MIMIIKCPANCEHDEYDFVHSVVVKARVIKIGDELFELILFFIVCRMCDHWISRRINCDCPARCHGRSGGFTVVRTPYEEVESL